MKKSLKLLTLLTLTTSLFTNTSCDNKDSTPGGGGVTNPDLVINYYRFDETYDNWGIWAWCEAGSEVGSTGMFFSDFRTRTYEETGDWKWATMEIEFGKKYNTYTDWAGASNLSQLERVKEHFTGGFLIRDRSGGKDTDGDREFDWTQVDNNGVLNIYIITGNTSNYYAIEDVPTSPIKDVYFSSTTEINMDTYFAFDDFDKDKLQIVDDTRAVYPVENVFPQGSGKKIVLKDAYADYTKQLTFIYDGEKHPISFKKVFNTKEFNDLYKYDGKDLGAVVSEDGASTTFKVWSPSATDIKVNIYESATSAGIKESFTMTKGEKGVFEYTISSDLHGTYYSYTVTVFGKTNAEVSDPYASSSNANGKRSLVVNWSKIETQLTTEAPSATNHAALSVHEMHVRDFSIGDTWNGTEANKGKFLGLIEEGTKLSDGTKTGFDYVKDLGVTHIQLQPVYDFSSVDETKLNDPEYIAKPREGVYNWGYDPYCYSSLEGSYSSDPNDGLTRINEFRKVTEAYNKAGIGVIMDVVYNHMPSEKDSTYNSIMPDYYFRTNSYSGAGSDLATENAMVANMLVNTTESLSKRYNLAGFRFDLSGLIAKSAINALNTNLRSFDPDVILYGEGWNMYGGDKYLGKEQQATQGAFSNVTASKETRFGFFNDSYRDGMKGGVFNTTDRGFLQAAYEGKDNEAAAMATYKDKVLHGLSGSKAGSGGSWARHYEGVSVNYTECHDNLTLHDKLILSAPDLTEDEINQMQAIANSTTAMSTGISFYQLGNEFGRTKEVPQRWIDEKLIDLKGDKITSNKDNTKYYIHDSYNFNDEINAVNWNLVSENKAMVESFKSALALRNNEYTSLLRPTDLLNLKFATLSASEIGLEDEELAERILAYSYQDKNDDTQLLYVIINTSNETLTLSDDLVTNEYYVNGAQLAKSETVTSVELAPLSYYVGKITIQ